MNQVNTQAILVRAAKTFIQGFLAVFATGLVTVVDRVTLKALLVGAFGAGLSALMNVFIGVQEAK